MIIRLRRFDWECIERVLKLNQNLLNLCVCVLLVKSHKNQVKKVLHAYLFFCINSSSGAQIISFSDLYSISSETSQIETKVKNFALAKHTYTFCFSREILFSNSNHPSNLSSVNWLFVTLQEPILLLWKFL